MLANSPPRKPNCALAVANAMAVKNATSSIRTLSRRTARMRLFHRGITRRVKVNRRHPRNQSTVGLGFRGHLAPVRIGQEGGPVLLRFVAVLVGDQIDQLVLL